MPIFTLVLVWAASALVVCPVFADGDRPSAVLHDEIDQPDSPDAYPVLKGMWCNWGAGSCNPYACDNVTSFSGNWEHGMSLDYPAEWLVSPWTLDTWSDTSDDGIYQSGEEGDFITGAVYDQGCGRVVALGDNTFNQAYSTSGNYDFIRPI